jgi:TolA-binding protein
VQDYEKWKESSGFNSSSSIASIMLNDFNRRKYELPGDHVGRFQRLDERIKAYSTELGKLRDLSANLEALGGAQTLQRKSVVDTRLKALEGELSTLESNKSQAEQKFKEQKKTNPFLMEMGDLEKIKVPIGRSTTGQFIYETLGTIARTWGTAEIKKKLDSGRYRNLVAIAKNRINAAGMTETERTWYNSAYNAARDGGNYW